MNKIRSENAKAGSANWTITKPSRVLANGFAEIEGFTAPSGVSPGDALAVFVSTQALSFRAEVYRMGYYDGVGARLLASFDSIPGKAQAGPLPNPRGDVCCKWDESLSFTVRDDWVSGCYLIKLIAVGGSANGKQSYASFVVRSLFDEPIDFVVHRATATDAAYNGRLGGHTYELKVGRTNAVSLDRPEEVAHGAGRLLLHEYPMIRWLEREGFSLAYVSSADLHQSASPLFKAHGFLSIGHDEYWSYEMRENVEAAMGQGVSVGFFGANACYWQVRFENTILGAARIVVCYKPAWKFNDDPEVPLDSQYITTTWRDPILGRPEQQLMGVMYYNYLPTETPSRPFITANTRSWPYKGAGSSDGEQVPGLIGYEVDRIFSNDEKWQELGGPDGVKNPPIYTISGLVPLEETLILGRSPFEGVVPNPDLPKPLTADTVFTVRPSLARVFAAGTVDWGQGLLDAAGGSALVGMGVIRTAGFEHKTIVSLTRNVLHNFTVGPLGVFGVELSGVRKVYTERWGAPSAVLPWRPHTGRALAGNFLQATPRATIALLSNPGATTRRIAFLELQRGDVLATIYQEREGPHLLNGWHDDGDIVLAGDFLARGHDQLLFINNDGAPPNIGRLMIIDYFRGLPDRAYYEAWGDSPLLNGWCDQGDVILDGDFMGLGYAQVLFINQDGTPPNVGRLAIIDYSSGTPRQAYVERWGDNPLLDGWHDPGNIILAGDFLHRGNDQLLFINQDGASPSVGRVTIIDYSSGAPEQAFLELWGASALLNGWHDDGDVVVAGDFLDKGYDQLLLINNDGTPPNIGRLMVVDFSAGSPQPIVMETWGANSELNGWSLADVTLAGKFAAGGDQVAFLPS